MTNAELWLDALQRLAAHAAHEVNNALNGAAINLEVVRARAVGGGDAARLAQFADAAAEEVGSATALAGALVALARAAPAATDVAAVAAHAVTLLRAEARRQGLDLVLERPGSASGSTVAIDPLAARAGVVIALLHAVELAGARHGDSAGDTIAPLRCTVSAGPPVTVQIAPSEGVNFSLSTVAQLGRARVELTEGGGRVTVTFRPAGPEALS